MGGRASMYISTSLDLGERTSELRALTDRRGRPRHTHLHATALRKLPSLCFPCDCACIIEAYFLVLTWVINDYQGRLSDPQFQIRGKFHSNSLRSFAVVCMIRHVTSQLRSTAESRKSGIPVTVAWIRRCLTCSAYTVLVSIRTIQWNPHIVSFFVFNILYCCLLDCWRTIAL